jgi:Ni/Fe-hydrogenase 1 B-type cytochrome subunit
MRDRDRVYVWQWPVRLIHWALVITIVALSITGFYIADPFVATQGPTSEYGVMSWMRHVHFWAAMIFAAAVFARVAWMFLGNQYASWKEIVPASKKRLRGLYEMIRFYAFPAGRRPEYTGHNPLAGLSYVGFYLIAILLIVSGFAMYSVSAAVDSPMRWFRFLLPIFGGAQTARWLHHALMWVVFAFAMFHVYAAVFVSRVEKNGTVESIVTGFKFVRRGGHG